MLPSPTIRKFFREIFSGSEPVVLTNAQAQHDWLVPVQKQLDALVRVECKFRVIHRLKLSEQLNELDITISPNESGRRWGDSERCRLAFGNGAEGLRIGELFISEDNWQRRKIEPAKVSSAEEIVTLVDRIKARQDRSALRDKKNTKLSNLKESGMKARLRELGSEYDFCFAIGQNARNVNLSLRVAGRKTGFHFSFPKGKFDEVIEALPQLLENFEHMAGMGMTFRTNNKKWGLSEWIFPYREDDEDE